MKNAKPTYSIVIPTYNHLEDCLKPCLESIIKNTDLSEVEIIVVANGCTDGTLAYLQDLGQSIFKTPGSSLKIVWLKDPSGYTKSTNAGIQSATGKYIVLLNNDNVILGFGEKSGWLRTLREPFLHDSKVGITGVAKDFHIGTSSSFLLFFCVMLTSDIIEKAGLLDEIFNPGYGEDIDYCYRLRNLGYKVVQVPEDIHLTAPRDRHEINFPLWHKSSVTVHEVPGWEDIVQRNEKILKARYVTKMQSQVSDPLYSIVIPTYNHLEDCLKPCLESIIKNTDLSNKEVIVVANGCTDGTRAYVESLGKPFRLVWMNEAAGYIKPTNAGIRAARGKYVILLNNDTAILGYAGKNAWVSMLAKPFEQNAAMGISGPLKISHPPTGIVYMHFFCVMIRKDVFDTIGYLDEEFGYGYSEDADFCARATKAGFLIEQVPTQEHYAAGSTFPIWHNGGITFNECPQFKPVDFSNEKRLVEKYGIGQTNLVKDNTINVGNILEQSSPDKIYPIMDDWVRAISGGARIVTALNDRTVATIATGGHPIGLSHGIGSRKNIISKKMPIADIKETVLAAGSRDLGIFGGRYVGGYNLQQDPDELSSLLKDLSHMKVQNYLEIGVADSGVTRIMCDVLDIQNVFTMDLGWMTGEFPTAYRDNVENLCNSGKVSIFRGDSHSAEADRWLRETGKQFDLIFIDGDHTYDGAMQDTVLAMKYAKPGCIFVFHDHAGVDGVTRLFNDLVQKKLPDLTFVKEYVSEGATKKGLSVFRYKQEESSKPKYSIVIPTYNHLNDCLKPCIESIIKFTDLSQTEVIVVANGCVDGTRDYVNSLGDPFKLVWFDEQLGYIKATNAGIRAAKGEYVVLLNNDIVLLGQGKHDWINVLAAPFADPKTGISGPLKSWREDIRNEYILFFCAMMRRSLFDEIGLLDEAFGIGYHEDTDFSLRTKKAGYRLAQVPNDVDYNPDNTGPDSSSPIQFPIYHPGGSTFFPIYGNSEERLGRGMKILHEKHKTVITAEYEKRCSIPNDIFEHLPVLKKYASECKHITEIGVRGVVSTWAFLAGFPRKMRCYDIAPCPNITTAAEACKNEMIDFQFQLADSRSCEIEPTDLLFIDTLHTYDQLVVELRLHGPKSSRYIILHDTTTFGDLSQAGDGTSVEFQPGSKGLRHAVEEFLAVHPEWKLKEVFHNNNGLTILERERHAVSIVIPTYNHLEDCLKPCLESIIKNTDLSDKEVIVVANGCTDGTRAYVESLGKSFRLIWSDEPLGYPKATNAGIKEATGAYVVLLNNDAVLLPRPKDNWIDLLKAPFLQNPQIGASGPLGVMDSYIDSPTLTFFCVMIKRDIFSLVGLLDESFSPGGCEDIDFIKRLEISGHTWAQVPLNEAMHESDYLNIGGFPIFHMGSATFSEVENYRSKIVRRNGLVILKRYNKNIRLALDLSKSWSKRYVTVGNSQDDSNIIMNPYRLEFEDGTVAEIHAGNLLERVEEVKRPQIIDGWLRTLRADGTLFMDSGDIVKGKEQKPSVSIVIPTFNHLEDCLKPCIKAIQENTDLSDKEVIVVANGCTDETRAYVESLGKPFRLIWSDEPLGYSRPLNIGIKASKGDYVICMNNDSILMPQPRNTWINMLLSPFQSDEKMGIAGPLSIFDRNSNHKVLLSFCIAISRKVFDTIGYLDEYYGMGGGEDVDFIIRAENAGFAWTQVPDNNTSRPNMMTMGNFPIYHGGGSSREDLEKLNPNQNLSARNALHNMRKYNKNIRLTFDLTTDLSNPDKPTPLTVGLAGEPNVAIVMDPLNLDFYENSVQEIHAGNKLESVPVENIKTVLNGWMKVLSVGGKLFLDSKEAGSFVVEKTALPSISDRELPIGWFSPDDISTYRSVVSRVPKGGKIVEIGIWQGRSMCSISDIIQQNELTATAVDTFRGTEDKEGSHLARMAEQIDVKSIFLANVNRFGISSRVSVRQMPSVEAAATFADGSLDCIFIDADHSYEAVVADIKAWLPKLKNGGIICGHDYATYSNDAIAVMRAVDEAFAPNVKFGGAVWYCSPPTRGKVYDCFPFFNELELLELRLNEMDSVVDKFVISEMPVTHSGKPKPLYFEENKERFKKFLHKIIHIVPTDYPTGTDPWLREHHQRDCLKRGLGDCNDNDIIIVSDLDEIPNPEAVRSYKMETGFATLEQKMYYYYLNCINPNLPWIRAKIFTYGRYKNESLSLMRQYHMGEIIPNGGWHFSFLGGTDAIVNKISSFAHHEYNNDMFKDVKQIQQRIEGGQDLFGRNGQFSEIRQVPIDESFPRYVRENMSKFISLGFIQPYKSKVYDCFPFFNELDLLEIRLNELDPYVDVFVISEMTVTHSGKPKPLYFEENKERFQKFAHKIRYIIADKYPHSDDPWVREHYQRDALMEGLYNCRSEDIIILSDLDEIPRGSQIQEYKKGQGVRYFEQNIYNFFLNLCGGKDKLDRGVFSKIVSFDHFFKTQDSLTSLRYHPCSESDKIENGGWHFRWTGGAEKIVEKLESWAHQEWNLPKYKNLSEIEAAIADGVDFFGRDMYDFRFVPLDSSFPKFIVDNQNKFKKLIRDCAAPADKVLTIV